MKKVLDSIRMESVWPQEGYTIWQKSNQTGQTFWGVGNFCGFERIVVEKGQDLTALEWDGNGVIINDSANILSMIIYALGIAAAWKKQMETDYMGTPFDILLSLDNGGDGVSPSVTIRFWAVRNQEHYITPTVAELEKFSQPVLMEQVNLFPESC